MEPVYPWYPVVVLVSLINWGFLVWDTHTFSFALNAAAVELLQSKPYETT